MSSVATQAFTVKKLCQQVHSEVTLKYPYVADEVQYHVPDYWNLIAQAPEAAGDCEDYVLQMKWQLWNAGLDPEDMRIGICETETGGTHAVLVVTDPVHNCDYILDQRQKVVMTPDEIVAAGYKGIMIQRPGHMLWHKWSI